MKMRRDKNRKTLRKARLAYLSPEVRFELDYLEAHMFDALYNRIRDKQRPPIRLDEVGQEELRGILLEAWDKIYRPPYRIWTESRPQTEEEKRERISAPIHIVWNGKYSYAVQEDPNL